MSIQDILNDDAIFGPVKINQKCKYCKCFITKINDINNGMCSKCFNKYGELYCNKCDVWVLKYCFKQHEKTKKHLDIPIKTKLKLSKKIQCETCNCLVFRQDIKRHNLTKKHINNIKSYV
jgi:hypothetical protein